MARNKTTRKKQLIVIAGRQNRRMPLFVVAKTKRRVRYNRMSRNWLTSKLSLDDSK
mgnify:CR=1 FL=1